MNSFFIRRASGLRAFTAFALTAAACIFATAQYASADAPRATAFQARVTDAQSAPVTAPIDVKIEIWDAAQGGRALYTEEHRAIVPSGTGAIDLQIGTGQAQSPLFGFGPGLFTGDRYLGLTIGGEVLSPRQPIASVPFAFRSDEARHAERADRCDVATEATRIASGAPLSLGASAPVTKLDVVGNGDVSGLLGVAARIRASEQQDEDAALLVGVLNGNSPFIGTQAGNPATRGLSLVTQNTIRLFVDEGGNVGIGSVFPAATLDVAGPIAVNGRTVVDSAGNWLGTAIAGPKGDPGLQGLQGLKGDKGDPGPAGSGSLTFKTIDSPSGTDPVADSATDTLKLVAGPNVQITGDATSDTVTISASAVRLFGVCANKPAGSLQYQNQCSCGSATRITSQQGPCTLATEGIPCSATDLGSCCVCRP